LNYIEAIKEHDDKIKSYISLNDKFEEEYNSQKDLGPLNGMIFAIKDNINVRGMKTTCASKILENYTSSYDATVISKLREAGAAFIGKTNLDEFAMGSSTENSAFFTTKNPYDLQRVAGGSSGGSAAAVAAGFADIALGSDTGGSVRQPASFCNLFGYKPTYGALSRFGLVAFSSSLDQIGIISKNIDDVLRTFPIMAGKDPKDSTSLDIDTKNLKDLVNSKKEMKIATIKDITKGATEDVKNTYERTINDLEKLGYKIEEVNLESIKYSVELYYIIAPSEASSNLLRFDGIRYGKRFESNNIKELYQKVRTKGFGREVKRRILTGIFALSSGYYDEYFSLAMKGRKKVTEDLNKIFEDYDSILMPTVPFPAFKIGELIDDPLSLYLADIYTIPANLAGIPAISFPSYPSKENLPIGMQLLSKRFDDWKILNIAKNFSKYTGFENLSASL
jgi:aspartyl-tRNA(Asn)/glutamyl-tRNA(Gln) amidotransferase subunit A